MSGALDDIRVIDLTHALNGPFCTMLLGHLGAEVIKIEPPAGDAYRRVWMAPDSPVDGYEFMMVNSNKKSVVVNLKTEGGRDLLKRLIAVSDVLVENYQKGTMESFGLDYESIRDINPRLIYACSRGYGDWGPYSAYGSNAGVNNAMTGWTHHAWELNGKPGTKALGIGDEAGGVSMCVGILAALHNRERTGVGQKVEISMQESLLGFLVGTFHEHFTGNRTGNPLAEASDGYFTLNVRNLTDENWKKLATLMEREELIDDPRFATPEARRKNGRELNQIAFAWAKGRTRQQLWVDLRDLGYMGAPVLSLGEVIEDPHLAAREAFLEAEHPVAGPIKLLAPWIHLSETPSSIRAMSPTIGQHTDQVLTGLLGCSPEDVDQLRTEGVVR